MPTTGEFLTQAEMRSLCDAAEAAWRRHTRKRAKVESAAAGERAKVAFTWKGQAYTAQRSRYELTIETADGASVARRYYD